MVPIIQAATGFFCTGVKPVIHLDTVEGYELKLTGNHLVCRVTETSRDNARTEWCAAKDLKPSDRITINDHRLSTAWAGPYTFDEGYLAGLLMGDGTLKADKAVLSVWIDPRAPAAQRPHCGDGIRAEVRHGFQMPFRFSRLDSGKGTQ